MWGNTQGWFIALLMLGGLVFGLHKLNQLGEVSATTGFAQNPANLAPVALPIPPDKIVDMSGAADAKALYRAAIDDYNANRDAYDRFAKSKDVSESEKLAGLQKLLEATHAGKATIFADDPGEIVTYGD